jgi:phage-related protein (TIGR01555 family)
MSNDPGKYRLNKDSLSRLLAEQGGLGQSNYDPLETTTINPPRKYTQQELTNAYRNIWACRKVCDFLPRMMAQGWGRIDLRNNTEMENKVNKDLDKLKHKYREGQRLANLYGGSVIVRMIEDGRDYSEPIGKNVPSIEYSRVFTPWEIYPYIDSLFDDVLNPEYYQMVTHIDKNETSIRIHRDRVIRFRGASTDFQSMRNNRGYEDSLLLPFLDPCLRYLTAISYVGASVTSFEFVIHKLQNLFFELENDESQRHLAERLRVAHHSLSALRGMVIDKTEEDVSVVSRSYAGVTEIINSLRDEMVAASGLTKPQFTQEHPSGLAATGQSERLAEADNIRALQSEKWGELIEMDCMLTLQKYKYTLPNWIWAWNSLFQLNPLEDAELHERQANADSVRISSGVMSPEEIKKIRFENMNERI